MRCEICHIEPVVDNKKFPKMCRKCAMHLRKYYNAKHRIKNNLHHPGTSEDNIQLCVHYFLPYRHSKRLPDSLVELIDRWRSVHGE